MPDLISHPTAQALNLFGSGKLSEAQAATVAAHLETCADCRKAVAGLPPGSFEGKVRAARPSTSSPPTPRPGGPASVMGKETAVGAAPPNVPPQLANHPKFRIVRELGRGGMGVIYQAEHRVMEKQVALKVISPAVLDNPQALARFHGEAKAAGKLDHQNIARAFDADQAGDLHFLVMEFVEGIDLAKYVEKKGPLPVAHACHFIRQAALGLQHAHEHGMVHRDIKPQNLMLTPKGLVKVLDFGLGASACNERKARAQKVTPGWTSFMGTAEYVSPEQASDAREADIRADIYSLGCTLYALLAGRPPFAGTVVNVVMAHIEKEAQPLHELRPEVSAELSAVVAKMLAKDPAQRYQTPGEVAQALVPFIKGGGKPRVPNAAPGPPGVASAGTGTRIGGDTSRVKGLGTGVSKVLAQAVPAAVEEEKGSPFAGLADAPAAAPESKKAKKERNKANYAPAVWWKRPVVLVGAGGASLLLAVLILWVAVFRVKTADGSILVIEVNEPNADVFVDGEKVAVTWDKGGKKAEISVKPGTRKVEVKKAGFTVYGEEVEIEDGRRRVLTARLVTPGPTSPRDEKPALPAADDVVAKIKKVSGIELVAIPKGSFYMGSKADDKDAGDDEKPQHKVTISQPFYLGKFHVTVGQFKRFVDATGYKTEDEKASGAKTWKNPGFDQTDDHPVVWVSWNDADAFCNWLAKETGAKVRLPREAEWEYSCRAGTPTKFYFGDNGADLGDYAWYTKNTNDKGTQPCGLKKKNEFGLYDMHGLVYDWCADGKRLYEGQEETDPAGPSAGAPRMSRGGSYFLDPRFCRAASRLVRAPSDRYFDIGFRVFVENRNIEIKELPGAQPDKQTRPDPIALPAADDVVAKVKKVSGIELVAIPKGSFYMGSKADDKDAYGDEKPRHKVTISQPFYLGKFHVTVGQFKRFVDATGYKTEGEKAGDEHTWKNPGFEQTDEHPVVCVSWNDADAFCQWLAKETGANVRLPREAEWEYSCRAGTPTKFYFGNNDADLGDYAWYAKNTNNKGTQPCGLKTPNGFGLYDMHGLAWEWCADGKRPYKDQEETDPAGPSAGAFRKSRGGSFFLDPRFCRAASRLVRAPSDRYFDIGFRVLVEKTPPSSGDGFALMVENLKSDVRKLQNEYQENTGKVLPGFGYMNAGPAINMGIIADGIEKVQSENNTQQEKAVLIVEIINVKLGDGPERITSPWIRNRLMSVLEGKEYKRILEKVSGKQIVMK